MAKKLLFLICLSMCVACPGHTGVNVFLENGTQRIYKYSSCSVGDRFPQMISIPFFKSATQIVPNCRTYPKHKTALALMAFYHHWHKNFGDEGQVIKNLLEKVMIEWGTEKKRLKSAYNIRGEKRENPIIIGVVKSKSYVWVWEGYDHKISESSLIHELVHISLRAHNGHGDADHEGDKYYGWTRRHTEMILEAKEALRSFGI